MKDGHADTGQQALKEVEWRHDDPRHSGETLVENTSDACVKHGSRALRGHQRG